MESRGYAYGMTKEQTDEISEIIKELSRLNDLIHSMNFTIGGTRSSVISGRLESTQRTLVWTLTKLSETLDTQVFKYAQS